MDIKAREETRRERKSSNESERRESENRKEREAGVWMKSREEKEKNERTDGRSEYRRANLPSLEGLDFFVLFFPFSLSLFSSFVSAVI